MADNNTLAAELPTGPNPVLKKLEQTLGLENVNGAWQITHQHQSVPLYMDKNGQAATDLKP